MDRRRFLASTAGATSVLIAGCTARLGIGGSGDGERPLEPVTRWALPVEDAPEPIHGYQVQSVAPARALAAVDGLAEQDLRPWMGPASYIWEQFGVEAVDRVVDVAPVGHQTIGGYAAYEGAFDAEELAAGIDPHPMTATSTVGEYEGYDLVRTTTDGGSVGFHAVSDETAIAVNPRGRRPDGLDPIHRVVDAGAGDTDTIADQDEHARAIAERLSPGLQLQVRLHDPDEYDETQPRFGLFGGLVAGGSSADVTADASELHWVHVFEDESARASAQLSAWVDPYRESSDVDSVSTTADGRVHETTVTAPPDVIFQV